MISTANQTNSKLSNSSNCHFSDNNKKSQPTSIFLSNWPNYIANSNRFSSLQDMLPYLSVLATWYDALEY